jgi:hypothetical protein
MSRKTNSSSDGVPQRGRRDLLKRALLVLGVGVLTQPNGGVSGSAFADTAKTSGTAKNKPLKPTAKTGSGATKTFKSIGASKPIKSGAKVN